MRARLRQIGADLRGSYWFIPTVLTVTAIILSLITWSFDTHFELTVLNKLAYFSEAKPEGARSILSTIAGSMISVAGTVFAVTFAAVVYASGSYGPRLLTNFMTDRGNQFSLGVFIATYVFALLTLRTIRLPNETGSGPDSAGFVPELSLLTALTLAMLSVGVLVYFLHHVPNSIRINNVVAGIGETVLRQVKERFPSSWAGGALDTDGVEAGEPVLARETGYLKVVDYETLGEVTKGTGRSVRLAIRTGDFVHPGMALAWVEGGLTDEVRDRVLSAFATGTSRTTTQDIEFSVDELVEIALRALSPGINDPFTAITCLHWITASLASLGGRDLARDADGRRYGAERVYCLADEFGHFVKRTVVAVSTGVASNDLASIVFVQAMAAAAPSCATPERRRALFHATADMMEQARLSLEGPALERLESAWADAQMHFGDEVG